MYLDYNTHKNQQGDKQHGSWEWKRASWLWTHDEQWTIWNVILSSLQMLYFSSNLTVFVDTLCASVIQFLYDDACDSQRKNRNTFGVLEMGTVLSIDSARKQAYRCALIIWLRYHIDFIFLARLFGVGVYIVARRVSFLFFFPHFHLSYTFFFFFLLFLCFALRCAPHQRISAPFLLVCIEQRITFSIWVRLRYRKR